VKLDNTNEKLKEESLEPKTQNVLSEPIKTPTTAGEFKLSNFKFNHEQSFSSTLNNKSSDFVFGDKKTSPLSKTPEMKFSTPSFNFGTNATFSFKPTEQQNDNKPFFSFGSNPSNTNSVPDSSKNTEIQKPKDEEEDEDQPPIVNFTPVKENDAIFETKSKLYCLQNGKYEERGVGQLYLKPIDDKKIQLIMRNDSALGTIMANTLLNESVNFTKRNAKNVQLICVLDATKSTKPQTVLFKFKDSQIADAFENELLKLKK
jgi:nuclear pore complex protein Nup50